MQQDAERPTGKVTVDTADPSRPSFVIHENVAWDALAYSDQLAELMGRAAAVCFGTLAQRSEPSRHTIHRCLEDARQAKIFYDVNLRQDWYHLDWLEASLRLAHVVKLNADEAEMLTDLLGLDTKELDSFCMKLADKYEVETICITRAERGCLVHESSETVDIPGEEVVCVDAVGAGDAFTAAFIAAGLRGWPLQVRASFANRIGALVASRSGAMPELREEYSALLAAFDP